MTQKKVQYAELRELILTAIIITILIVVHESSWLDTAFFSVSNSEQTQDSRK